jgi:hypothetical protein
MAALAPTYGVRHGLGEFDFKVLDLPSLESSSLFWARVLAMFLGDQVLEDGRSDATDPQHFVMDETETLDAFFLLFDAHGHMLATDPCRLTFAQADERGDLTRTVSRPRDGHSAEPEKRTGDR